MVFFYVNMNKGDVNGANQIQAFDFRLKGK